MGGCNSFSESGVLKGLQSQPFMVVGKFRLSWLFMNTDEYLGADVGHPGPGVAKPSVTGLVFSYDEGATRYAAHRNSAASSRNHRVVAEDDGAGAGAIYRIPKDPPKEGHFLPRWSIGRRVQHRGDCRIGGNTRHVHVN